MQNNKTTEIFRLSVIESGTGLAAHGLTPSTLNGLVGAISRISQTENQFVQQAKKYANQFTKTVASLLDEINEQIEADGLNHYQKSDLATLEEMLTWEYDEDELVELARKDWEEPKLF